MTRQARLIERSAMRWRPENSQCQIANGHAVAHTRAWFQARRVLKRLTFLVVPSRSRPNSKQGPDDQAPAMRLDGHRRYDSYTIRERRSQVMFLAHTGTRWFVHIAGLQTDLPCLTQAFQLGLSRKI